jgi:diguanylate cyclase (GGDEF)-like protein
VFDNDLLDIIENGVVIIDENLKVFFWNKWLEINTKIFKNEIESNNLDDIFPDVSFNSLKRKIKISLKLKRPTYIDAKNSKYIIPIKKEKITNSIYTFMQQDVTIKPYKNNLIVILINDVTTLLEAEYTINKQLNLFESLATVDTLTQIYNRQKFNEILSVEIKRSKRYERTLSLIIFDIDHFKDVNDTYGHLEGDEVLKSISKLVKSLIRESDFLARWGGEEFTILLTETDLDGAIILAEKLRSKIEETVFGVVGDKTCSFGVSEYKDNSINEFIKEADSSLYFIKENGRNAIGIFNGEDFVRFSGGV